MTHTNEPADGCRDGQLYYRRATMMQMHRIVRQKDRKAPLRVKTSAQKKCIDCSIAPGCHQNAKRIWLERITTLSQMVVQCSKIWDQNRGLLSKLKRTKSSVHDDHKRTNEYRMICMLMNIRKFW
jgi:hypothetical protein